MSRTHARTGASMWHGANGVGSISPAMIQLCANEWCTDQICLAVSRLRLFPVIGWN